MTGVKTNERPRRLLDADFDPGTRAVLRHARVAPNKVREVLNLIRDLPVQEALDILRFSERDAAILVGKLLGSAIANAEHNDELEPEELYVSACFADEGTTIKRWRPRARGRATRIRKRTSHITVIVSRLPEDRLQRLAANRQAAQLEARRRRVAGGRRAAEAAEDGPSRAERRRRQRGGEPTEVEEVTDEVATEATDGDEVVDTTATAAEALEDATESDEVEDAAAAEEPAGDETPAAKDADTEESEK